MSWRKLALGLVLVAGLAFWVLTAPRVPTLDSAAVNADLAQGEMVFHAAGCASCHASPDATGEAKQVLAGGQRFETAFGTFLAPNISSDPVHGIGSWSDEDLVTAVIAGISPDGQHYYPAFPYASYAKMSQSDAFALAAYMRTLPASDTPSAPHEVGFPFNIRRSLGGWKLLFLRDGWVVDSDLSPEETRGRYLVEALGHCAECHTPRNALGGLQTGNWLAGGPNPDGKGKIPNITPAALDWSEADIAEYLKSGFTPDYDSVGGSMADVVENTARLTQEDRLAIAAYLKVVPSSQPN